MAVGFAIAWVAILEVAAAEAPGAAGPDRWAPFFRAGCLRALVLSGRNNHGWRSTTPYLRELLERTGRFDVRVNEAVDGLTADSLAPFDVLIMDYGGPRWGEATERAVEEFVRGGGGFVGVHGASYHFSGLAVLTDGHRAVAGQEAAWPGFRRLVGCGWDAVPPQGFHGPRHSFSVRVTGGDHPITKGLPESFRATDELYQGMTLAPGAQVLAVAHSDAERGGTDRDEPMLVASRFGFGRTFYTALGHETAAMWEPGFRATFLRGVEWAATGKVTLPPNAGWAVSQPGALRVLVVTGGHDYDPSFYTLFEDLPGVAWRHVASNQDALRGDLRSSTDVLVLYDLSQVLDEAGRGHLRDFAEGGKGLVILHHALADYQDWDWWWREVVGGRYVLTAEPGYPASDYRQGEWVELTPAGAHPVIGEVGAVRLLDEPYSKVWHADGIQPLFKTSHPASDDVVAWISPWKASRVVVIQPGHDRYSHRHPAYRQLVANAIRWAGGRP